MDAGSINVASQTDDSKVLRIQLLDRTTTINSSQRSSISRRNSDESSISRRNSDDSSIQIEDNNQCVKLNISIVLVGSTGKGKSATGNTILGGKPFVSMPSASSVTHTCEMKSTVLDGRTINVIDTQGFCDIVTDHNLIIEELNKCFDLANNEIHAILLVVSIRNRFSKEEAATIRNLKMILGPNIVNYVIVAFTGGDDLDEQNKSLDDYLGSDCPVPLKEIIEECGNRCILFDNRTKEQSKKDEQVRQLFSKVDMMINGNGGKSFKHGMYELKKRNEELLQEYQMIGQVGKDHTQTPNDKGGDHAKYMRKLQGILSRGFAWLRELTGIIIGFVIRLFKRPN